MRDLVEGLTSLLSVIGGSHGLRWVRGGRAAKGVSRMFFVRHGLGDRLVMLMGDTVD